MKWKKKLADSVRFSDSQSRKSGSFNNFSFPLTSSRFRSNYSALFLCWMKSVGEKNKVFLHHHSSCGNCDSAVEWIGRCCEIIFTEFFFSFTKKSNHNFSESGQQTHVELLQVFRSVLFYGNSCGLGNFCFCRRCLACLLSALSCLSSVSRRFTWQNWQIARCLQIKCVSTYLLIFFRVAIRFVGNNSHETSLLFINGASSSHLVRENHRTEKLFPSARCQCWESTEEMSKLFPPSS